MSEAAYVSQLQPEAVPKQPTEKTYRYFDQPSPEMPKEIMGINSETILKLGQTASELGVLPPNANLGIYALPSALVIFPLVEKVQSGEQITPEKVRPYRRAIKGLLPRLKRVDRIAKTTSMLGVGVAIRRRLNQRIEQEFPARAQDAIEVARPAIESLESDIETIAEYQNPRDQFATEVNYLASETRRAIAAAYTNRLERGGEIELPSPPKGIRGLLTRAFRAVKRVFSLFKRHPRVENRVTAYDAAEGIEKVLTRLKENGAEIKEKMPLVSKLLLPKLPDAPLPSRDHLAFMAPEILTSLFSLSSDDESDSLLDSVHLAPHEFRFITRYRRRFGRYDLSHLQHAALTMLPNIRDLLPENGQTLKDTYASLRHLLRQIK